MVSACLAQLRRWGVSRWYADGALPAPGVYGVHEGPTEVVLLARVDELPRPSVAPVPGLEVRRAVGVNGTRLSGYLGEEVVGYVEVEANLGDGGRLAQLAAGPMSATSR